MRRGCVLIAAFIATTQVAWGDASTVAVLPWTASSPDLKLYGEPMARAVVKRLKKSSKIRFKAITGTVAVPDEVDLVIDGRVVGEGDRVRLEARIRNPELGRSIATLSTKWSVLEKLDELADELAQSLDAGVKRALAQRASASAARKQPAAQAKAVPAKSRRRRMVVLQAAGEAADGAVPVTEPATRAALSLAHGLGFEPVPARERGLLDSANAKAVVRAYRGDYALVVYVGRVAFAWQRVLTARGRVRIALFDAEGETRFDRWFSTDTLVGSRGDSHGALVYFVTEQAGLIAKPLLQKAMR